MGTNTVYCEKCGQEVGGVDQWIAISRADDEKIAALTEERNKWKEQCRQERENWVALETERDRYKTAIEEIIPAMECVVEYAARFTPASYVGQWRENIMKAKKALKPT